MINWFQKCRTIYLALRNTKDLFLKMIWCFAYQQIILQHWHFSKFNPPEISLRYDIWMILEHIYFRYLASPCQREGSTLSTWWVLPPSSGLSSCPVFIWPLCRATTRMDSAPLSPPTVTSHPGSPATVTGGLDPGWQSSTGEPLPYSLSITGDPPYLSLATNGTPVNIVKQQRN